MLNLGKLCTEHRRLEHDCNVCYNTFHFLPLYFLPGWFPSKLNVILNNGFSWYWPKSQVLFRLVQQVEVSLVVILLSQIIIAFDMVNSHVVNHRTTYITSTIHTCTVEVGMSLINGLPNKGPISWAFTCTFLCTCMCIHRPLPPNLPPALSGRSRWWPSSTWPLSVSSFTWSVRCAREALLTARSGSTLLHVCRRWVMWSCFLLLL